MRCVMTRVLPLPGPARISAGPSVVVTANLCGSFRPISKSCSTMIYHPYFLLNIPEIALCYHIMVGGNHTTGMGH